MKDPIKFIRKKIFNACSGSVTLDGNNVLFYNRVPSDTTYPFVRVYGLSTSQIDDNQSKYNVECITRIEVVTRFLGDVGGDLDANDIMTQIMNLLITKNQSAFDLSADNFNCYAVTNNGVTYLQDDLTDHTYFRAILELSNKVEQIS
jgi:hypothetical protein|tara:strand:- start:2072 stop:2512 length:441 start_codon:yes stop_codon:yes gene_type:complete